MIGSVIKFRGAKFEVTSMKEDGTIGAKQLNPNNGKPRKNAKEITLKIEQVEVVEWF